MSYYSDELNTDLWDVDTVLKQVEVSYEKPIIEKGDLKVELEISEIGETSVSIDYTLSVEGEIVATATTVQVFYDSEKESSKPIPVKLRKLMNNR